MTVDQIPSPLANEAHLKDENDKITCQDVGLIFAREYYTFLNKKPSRLHGFYGADSLFIRGDEAESVPILKGQEEIRKKIEELDFDNCKVLVTQVDSQISSNDGILISVLGEISNKNMPSQKFSETFFLAPQPNGYYVLNNIFRLLKEKVDIDYHLCEKEEDVDVPNLQAQESDYLSKAKEEEKIEIKKEDNPPMTTSQDELIDPKQEEVKVEEDILEEKKSPETKKVEEKVPKEEKKTNETKAVVNNKSIESSIKQEEHHKEAEIVKKEKQLRKSASTKRVEEQPVTTSDMSTVNIVPLPNNKEQQTNNKGDTTTAKDYNKHNQKGVNKPTSNGVKTWASLAAPTPTPSNNESASEPSESSNRPPQQHQNHNQQQHTTPISQPIHSPNIHAHNIVPPPQHANASYHTQQQQHNTHYNQNYQHYHRDGQQQHHHQQRRDTQIYVKNVTSAMTETQLEEEFSKFGPIKSINIGHSRNCAFIDFGSIESTKKALEQHKVMIAGNQQVLAEERRPPRYPRQQYDNNNSNNSRRYQQNRRGSGTSGTTGRGGAASSSAAGVNNPLDKRGGGGAGVGQK